MSALLLLLLAAKAPVVVSVMPFDNRTGDAQYDVMEKGLADMLLTDLAGAPGLTVVERTRLADVIGELKLQRSDLFDVSTVQRVGKLAGATHLVTGQVLKVAPELRLDVRLLEVGSGKVLYGANVAGSADRLFELEQELVTRFLDGLGQKGVLPPRSGPQKLETLLKYSQALADADRGDLKSASTTLATVLKTDADFKLARSRYAELLRRLKEAGARREEALSAGEAELLARIEEKISKPDPKKVREYLGYRAMRAHFALMQLRKLLGPATVPSNPAVITIVPRSKRPQARALLLDFFQAYLKLIEEEERTKERADRTPDHARAEELGLGSSPEASYGRLELAELVFQGELRTFQPLERLSPRPALLEPRLSELGLKLFEEELAKSSGPRRLSEVALAHGDALLALGRKEDAIARWQTALDELPTSPLYGELEARVEKALGVHKLWKDLDAATSCDQGLMAAWSSAAYPLVAFDVEALFERAEKVPALCAKKAPPYPAVKVAGWMQIAYAASIAGDCPTWARAAALAKKLDPDTGKAIEAYAPGCLQWEQ